MSGRRTFIKSGALALGGLWLSKQMDASILHKEATHAVGLQLYTLSAVIETDLEGTLKKVAAIGYKEIESAPTRKGPYYGLKPKEFASKLKDLGMTWTAHHAGGLPRRPSGQPPTDSSGRPIVIPPSLNLKDNMQQLVDGAAEGGLAYLVCSSTAMSTLDEVKNSLDVLNKTGEACKKAGINFAYHNHDFEFKTIEGKIPYDMLLSQTSPDNVKLELDLCWSTKAGADPVELFKKNPGRFHLWHTKDIDKDMKGPQPVGTGIVDFKRVFANAGIAGMKHFFVEHDRPADPYASITTSFKNLQQIMG